MTTKAAILGIVDRIEHEEGCRVKDTGALLNRIINFGAFTNEERFNLDLCRALEDGILEESK